MKKTYRVLYEKVQGRTREFILVMDKKLIQKLPTGYARGFFKEPNVRNKKKK